MIIFLQKFIF